MLRVSEQDGHRRREGFISSYRQLGASLLDLQEAADQVFDTISQRAGIDSISSSNGSLIIRSPSKYPSASASERDFRPLFRNKDGSSSPCVPVANILVDGGLNREFGLDGTLELFQFFTEANISDFQKEGHPKM